MEVLLTLKYWEWSIRDMGQTLLALFIYIDQGGCLVYSSEVGGRVNIVLCRVAYSIKMTYDSINSKISSKTTQWLQCSRIAAVYKNSYDPQWFMNVICTLS